MKTFAIASAKFLNHSNQDAPMKSKYNKREEVMVLATEELARRFDIPQLAGAEFADIDGGLMCPVQCTPHGQMALLVQSLRVTVTVTEEAPHYPNLYRVNVKMDYEHRSGSNSYQAHYVAVLGTGSFGKLKLLGLVEREAFKGIEEAVDGVWSERVRKNNQAKAGKGQA